MLGRDIIVLGASAGGVEALPQLVASLPENLNAAVFVVLHISPSAQSWLPTILTKAGRLPAMHATDGQPIEPGKIYVAPPDKHLILQLGRMRLVHGPKEHWTRPAIDPLFRSAAIVYGPRVIGVVLTGYLDDGTAGLLAIKDRGGIAIVQDPAEAFEPSMPRSAMESVPIDHCARLSEIGSLVIHYDPPSAELQEISPVMEVEHKMTAMEILIRDESELRKIAEPSEFTCPECNSPLYQLRDERIVRFRCCFGHGYSIKSLLNQLTVMREEAIWSAARSLSQEASLTRRLAAREAAAGRRDTSVQLLQKAESLAQQTKQIREVTRRA